MAARAVAERTPADSALILRTAAALFRLDVLSIGLLHASRSWLGEVSPRGRVRRVLLSKSDAFEVARRLAQEADPRAIARELTRLGL